MGARLWVPGAAVAILLACDPTADAQVGARTINELISRPAERGPSNLVGGYYTRRNPFETLQVARRDVALLGQEPLGFRSRRRSKSQFNPALHVAKTGLFGNLMPSEGVPLSAGLRGPDVSVLSGLDYALSLDLPLPYVGPNYVPPLSAAAYTPRSALTPFQSFFGLTPSAPKPEPSPIRSVAEGLEEQTMLRSQRAMREGLKSFKDGTVEARDARTGRYVNCLDCSEKLERAFQCFELAREIDRAADLPPLLMAHILLDEERTGLALRNLLEAFRRNPKLFAPASERLDRFFGDARGEPARSTVLDAQMRRHVRLGQLSLSSADAYSIEAYCAWRLGDVDHAREAAQEAEKLARDAPDRDARLLDWLTALQAALP